METPKFLVAAFLLIASSWSVGAKNFVADTFEGNCNAEFCTNLKTSIDGEGCVSMSLEAVKDIGETTWAVKEEVDEQLYAEKEQESNDLIGDIRSTDACVIDEDEEAETFLTKGVHSISNCCLQVPGQKGYAKITAVLTHQGQEMASFQIGGNIE